MKKDSIFSFSEKELVTVYTALVSFKMKMEANRDSLEERHEGALEEAIPMMDDLLKRFKAVLEEADNSPLSQSGE